MSDKGTIEQLHAELVQRDRKHKNNAKIIEVQGKELDKARAELARAQIKCNVLDRAFTDANELHAIVRGQLTQAREELAQAQTEIARVDKISDGYATGWADACAARDALAKERDDLEKSRQFFIDMAEGRDKNLAQARDELKDLQGANGALEQQVEHLTSNRDYWFEICRAVEAERDKIRKEAQEQSDDVQEHWLSPCQKAGLESLVETLRGRLKHAEDIRNFWIKEHDDLLQTIRRERQVAKATMVELKRVHRSAHVEAEGLRRQLKHAEGERDYWVKAHDELEMKLDNAATGEAAIVEAAKALLKQPYIFVGNPAESTMEIAAASKKLQAALEHRSEAAAKLLERLAEVELAAHILRESNFVLAQKVRTERALRQEAEECARAAQVMAQNRATRLEEAEQRAERAEALAATLAEVHAMLSCSPEHPWHGCTAQTVCNEAHYHNHVRGARELLEKVLEGETPTNTQALAALVNEETADLLERLAWHIDSRSAASSSKVTYMARNLAAQIREVLDGNNK